MQTQNNHPYNRRSNKRDSYFAKASYSANGKYNLRSELINLSRSGARLTTAKDIQIGDILHIASILPEGLEFQVKAEVCWAVPLPCGRRQIVGVMLLAPPTSVSRAA